MEIRQLGVGGPRVSAFGLGCMRMSARSTAADEAESIATIRAALDAGVTLLDTGDFYGMGHNHEIADARGATAAQLAIAWVLAQGRERGDIAAVVGSRTRQQLAEALPAAELIMTDEELAAIEQAVPASAVAGGRGAPGVKDGER